MKINPTKLKNLLYEKGITQRELAKLAGISESAVFFYAQGKITPRGKTAKRIAQVLGCDIKAFIDFDHK